MAVPKKRVSKTRGSLRHTNWKKEIIPQALIALSTGKRQANSTLPELSEPIIPESSAEKIDD